MKLLKQLQFKKNDKFFSKKRGFTLVETFVAISIFLIVLIPTMSLTADSLMSSYLARDQITASFLAQEGVEMVRYLRDTGALEGDSNWLENIGPAGSRCLNTNGCTIDPITKAVANCSIGIGCDPLKYNPTTRQYGYSGGPGWTESNFVRTIKVDDSISPDEAEIVSTVSWTTGRFDRTISVRERLYNWQCLLSLTDCT